MSCQLKRNLEWWTHVPIYHNASPMWNTIENAYIHCDSSGYGWGSVLNVCVEARGFWSTPDLEEHITYRELKAV